jgi:hypothetical protein
MMGAVLRVALALATLAVPAWVLGARGAAVLAGHPAHLLLLVALVVVGAGLLVRGRRPRPGAWRRAGRAVGAAALVGVLAATVWLGPFAATAPATASGDRVEVVDTATAWELRPRAAQRPTGLVFLPGARVDARAYLRLLRPLAEAGTLVVVVKPALQIALLASPSAVMDDRPQVARWVLGGHSLGGAAAAFAVDDPRVVGLVLWAAYPADDLSGSDLTVLSVSGDRDGLATPAEIDAARPLLPPTTRRVVVSGGTHAFFGDYGEQPGDGEPGVTREAAQSRIVLATAAFLFDL